MSGQTDFEYLLGFEKKDGSYVPAQAVADDGFAAKLSSFTRKECTMLLEMALAGKSHPILGRMGPQHIVHIIRRSKQLDEKVKETKPNPFKVEIKDNAHTGITTLRPEGRALIDLDCGYEDRTPHAMYKRMFAMSVGFTKSAADNAVKQVELPKASDQASQFTQNSQKSSVIVRRVMGDAKSVPELEEEAGAFLKVGGISERMPSFFQSSIPEKLRSCVTNVQSRLNNNKAMVIPDKHLRANSQLFAKVATTDKYGPGYYNQGHYDGTNLRGPIRKTYELLCDFDYQQNQPVVRLTTSDPAKAYALFNACKEKGKDVLVAYQSKTSGKVGDYFDEGKPKKYGVVPCDNITFTAVMRGYEKNVYYYDTSSPPGTAKYNPLNVYNANQKLVEKSSVLRLYGYYSYYTSLSHLVTKEEIKACCKINAEMTESRALMKGFSPSCKVRNGLIRVTPKGPMNYMDAFVNVIAGRLHYLTWFYRSQPFAYEKRPGDTYVQPVNVFVDVNNPDDASNNSESILSGIWDSLPDAIQQQIVAEGIYTDEEAKNSNDDDEEREEDEVDLLLSTFEAATSVAPEGDASGDALEG